LKKLCQKDNPLIFRKVSIHTLAEVFGFDTLFVRKWTGQRLTAAPLSSPNLRSGIDSFFAKYRAKPYKKCPKTNTF
jgi:hypothetical protein